MAFVNEFVSPEDFKKYGFKEINEQFRMIDEETDWTVDKEKNVYIRDIPWRAPSPGYNRFHMYWKGNLFFVYIAYGDNHLRSLVNMDLPKSLEKFKPEIIADLKEALQVYQGAGVWGLEGDFGFEVQFDF